MLREINEEAAEAKGDIVAEKIKALADSVTLKPDASREWMGKAEWMYREFKVIGQFEDSEYWLLQGKVSTWQSGRKTIGFVLAKTVGEGSGIERKVLATKDLDVAKACYAVWLRTGAMAYPEYLTEEYFRRNPNL